MEKRFIIFLILMTFPLFVFASYKTEYRQLLPFDSYSKTIVVDSTSSIKTVVYTAINKYDKSVILTDVFVSCRCITVEYPKSDIKPGESIQIKVSFNPQEYDTSIVRKIVVYSTLSSSEYSAILEMKVVRK